MEEKLKALKNRAPDWAFKLTEDQLLAKFVAVKKSLPIPQKLQEKYDSFSAGSLKQGEGGSGPGNPELGANEFANVPINATIISDDYAWLFEYYEVAYTSPSMVADYLDTANGRSIRLVISSPGGMVTAMTAIRDLIREYRSRNSNIRVEANIRFAVSAAMDIAFMASFRYADVSAVMAFHRVVTNVYGHADQIRYEADRLAAMDLNFARDAGSVLSISAEEYMERLRRAPDGLYFMTTGEAMEIGFIHRELLSNDNLERDASGNPTPTNSGGDNNDNKLQETENGRSQKTGEPKPEDDSEGSKTDTQTKEVNDDGRSEKLDGPGPELDKGGSADIPSEKGGDSSGDDIEKAETSGEEGEGSGGNPAESSTAKSGGEIPGEGSGGGEDPGSDEENSETRKGLEETSNKTLSFEEILAQKQREKLGTSFRKVADHLRNRDR